jgi:hypothetical protein
LAVGCTVGVRRTGEGGGTAGRAGALAEGVATGVDESVGAEEASAWIGGGADDVAIIGLGAAPPARRKDTADAITAQAAAATRRTSERRERGARSSVPGRETEMLDS